MCASAARGLRHPVSRHSQAVGLRPSTQYPPFSSFELLLVEGGGQRSGCNIYMYTCSVLTHCTYTECTVFTFIIQMQLMFFLKQHNVHLSFILKPSTIAAFFLTNVLRRRRLSFLVLKTISRWEVLRRVPSWAGCLGSNGSILTPLLTVMVVASKLVGWCQCWWHWVLWFQSCRRWDSWFQKGLHN